MGGQAVPGLGLTQVIEIKGSRRVERFLLRQRLPTSAGERMRRKNIIRGSIAVGVLGALVWAAMPGHRSSADVTLGGVSATIDPSCQAGSTPDNKTGTALDTFTSARSGVTYDTTSAQLSLVKQGGYISITSLGISDTVFMGCSGDFDEDGWTDFVGGDTDAIGYLKVYQNRTGDNPAPDWTDPTALRTPNFIQPTAAVNPTYIVEASSPVNHVGSMLCADFDGDGHMDFLIARCATVVNVGPIGTCDTVGRADIFLGNGDGTFKPPYQFTSDLNTVSPIDKEGTRYAYADYNGDGKKDLLVGLGDAGGGKVIVLLNDGLTPPHFNTSQTVLSNLGLGSGGANAIAVADFTNDGILDIAVGGYTGATLTLYPGLAGSGFSTSGQVLSGFSGGAASLLAADFGLHGKIDLVAATDNFGGFQGFNSYYYLNDGDSQPFSGGVTKTLTTYGNPGFDFDLGFVLDYDHDPQATPDFVILDGNNSANYYLFPNRVVDQFVDCGTVASDTVDIGSLATTEMTITDVRIAPTPATIPASDGTVTWEASNDNGVTWHPATACPDDATQLCSVFGATVGNQIRWRATLCSNTTGTPHIRTPTITGVSLAYTYVTATNHFRAGPIAGDGVVYVGALREPGDSGHVFAIDDQTGLHIWDAAPLLDANSARNVYTVEADGRTRLDLSTSTSDPAALQAVLLAPDSTTMGDIVTWAKSARFGLLAPLHVLGAVENSTGALLTRPSVPYWFVLPATTATERGLITAFVNDPLNVNRQNLLFVGSKDGGLHAFFTNPLSPTDPKNGQEAWAYVPYDVSQRFLGDKTAGQVTAYPDGSPTLVNAKVGGAWKTILVMGEGNGGRSVFALDVTNTIASDGTVVGPTPMWQFSDPNMGRTYSKPTVVRTLMGGTNETWLAIFASGPGVTSDVGDTLYAVDVTTGALVWRFDINDSNCFISSDITASETDDETGTSIDGFIDRILFADNKGRIWKIDPGNNIVGTTMSEVNSTVDVGLPHRALFSTRVTPGGLGVDRAISGTLTAATDFTNRMVLYFGTGGSEDTPAAAQNAFYAVYADTGAIRSKLDGSNGVAAGVKFYGGVVYESGQLVFTSGQDLSGLGLCAPSAGQIVAIDANTFTEQFSITTSSKIVAPVFAQNGEIYTVTLTGSLLASQYTGSFMGGGDTTGGVGFFSGGGSGGGSSGGGGGSGGGGSGPLTTVSTPFKVISWRQVY